MNMRIRMPTIWGLAVLAAWTSFAVPQGRSTTPVDCGAPATQRAMNVCAERGAAASVEKRVLINSSFCCAKAGA